MNTNGIPYKWDEGDRKLVTGDTLGMRVNMTYDGGYQPPAKPSAVAGLSSAVDVGKPTLDSGPQADQPFIVEKDGSCLTQLKSAASAAYVVGRKETAITVLETVLGIVRPDGTLELDQKVTVRPGRVRVRVESVEPFAPPAQTLVD